ITKICLFHGTRLPHLLKSKNMPDILYTALAESNKFAALLAAICARIGSRKAKSKAGFLPPFFVSPVVVWGMEVSACAGA
ncbi:hypothetical protein, partial [uncultured Desulfovibrio sp.]|uniref:hypothetical protein n=1 Tax=uncultured Desulfovibrio sp. TaxID=167968 RepID=UPI0026265D7C